MRYKVYPAARREIIQIWHYTDEHWGEAQADRYIRQLYKAISKTAANPRLWRKPDQKELAGIFYFKYKSHYIFFRVLSKGTLGIISILHENMDIPSRLKEDMESEEAKI